MVEAAQPEWAKPRGVGTKFLRGLAWLTPTRAKYTHGSLVAVSGPEQQFYLVRHWLREPDKFSFPGGSHKRREDPAAAANREVREETKLELELSDEDLVQAYRQPWALHFDHLYATSVDDATAYRVVSAEIRKGGWYEIGKDIQIEDLTVATRYALSKLRASGLYDQ